MHAGDVFLDPEGEVSVPACAFGAPMPHYRSILPRLVDENGIEYDHVVAADVGAQEYEAPSGGLVRIAARRRIRRRSSALDAGYDEVSGGAVVCIGVQ